MPWRIQVTDQPGPDEAQSLDALQAAVFPPRPRAKSAALPAQWAPPQWHFLLWLDERELAAYAGVVTRFGICDGERALLGGLGGVKTHPAHRGKGYASAAIGQAVDFLTRQQGVDFSLLYCRADLLSFYGRFGFQRYSGDTLALQYGTKTVFRWHEAMIAAGRKALPKCQALDLCGLPW